MSANGAVTTTLDFDFFGGGYTQLAGGVSGAIETSFVSYAKVPIVGEIQPITLDFSFVSSITAPIIQASADLSFSITGYGTMEFGVQRFATVDGPDANTQAILFEYTANSAGSVITHGYFTPTLDFTLDTHIYVFSLGDTTTGYSFNVESTGLNVSTRSYSRDGGSYCSFNSVEFNETIINDESNSIKINNTGITYAEILQK